MMQPDAKARLNTLLKASVNRPFAWGDFDCCLFVADAVKAMTGHDFAAPYRGRYTTELGALRALKRYGQGSLKNTLTALFGPMLGPRCATDGDIALVKTPTGDALGLVYRCGIWVTGPNGLDKLPLRFAKGAWEVTCQQ